MAAPDSVLALASGVPLAVLGGLLLTVRPRRPDLTFFGGFAILWGAQVTTVNLARVLGSDPVAYSRSLLASYALIAPTYLFLAHFTVLARPGRRFSWISGIALAWAIAAIAVVALAPERVVAQVVSGGAGRAIVLGPAALPLFSAPFFAAFSLALVSLHFQYREATPGTPRHRVRGLMLALALFPSYATTRYAIDFLRPPPSLRFTDPITGPAHVVVFTLGAAVILGIAVHAFLRPPPPQERDHGLVLALAGPAAVAIAERGVGAFGLQVETLGLWRFATVAAIVYTLARHQLFDLDVKLKRLAGPAVALLGFGFGGVAAVVRSADGATLAGVAGPLAVGIAIGGAGLLARGRIGDALFPGVSEAPDYLYRRKLDVYRASLERSVVEGRAGGDAQLRRLRRELDITEKEHQVMEYMVRQHLGTAAAPPVEAPPGAAPGALLHARYRVERLLGEGAHGRAYLARDERERRDVVLKTVGTQALGGRAARLLLREARLAGSLAHPNVITVHDVFETPQEAVIVMEHADGGSLLGLLRRRGALGWSEAVDLVDQVLAGLASAHAKGIVHRDVKPENVLLLADGTVKVADFGVARDVSPEATAGVTAGGAGTLLYMSPEQVRGLDADATSDLYSCGVLLHLLLTGRYYLRIAGKDDFQVRQLILEGEPHLALKDEPAWIRSALLRALAKEPAGRFQKAEEMRAALRGPTRALEAKA